MIEQFFAYARERYQIRLKRNAGEPKPWTDDPILAQYSFTEVFREDDKTTRWLNTYVREPMRDQDRVLPAVLIFRWFNRIKTGWSYLSTSSSPLLNPRKSGLLDSPARPRNVNFGSRRAMRMMLASCTCGSSETARFMNLNSQFGLPPT